MTETKRKIEAYQLLDHGIDHAQYFQGCGVSFTDYTHCVTGCGSNFSEALYDALEQVAMDDYDADTLEAQINADEGYTDMKQWPTVPNTDEAQEENEECELYYYVSIRYR